MADFLNSKKEDHNAQYIVVFFLTVFAILTPVFIINFISDPGDVYLQGFFKSRDSQEYVRLLMSSSHGIRKFGNERLIKGILARQAGNYDTVILGSSHAMQLGNIRMSKLFGSFFGRTLNLTVPGGTLEDTMIFSYTVLHNSRMPKAFLIEIGPWALKWNMDDRYLIHQDHLDGMFKELGVKPPQTTGPYWLRLFANAVNLEYFKQSLNHLKDPSFSVIPYHPLKEFGDVGPFDYEKGLDFKVTLRDGSSMYEKNYAEGFRVDQYKNMEGYYYKLKGEDYDENAIGVFEKLIDLIRARGIKVYFLLTPYNPVFFRSEDTLPARRFARVEKKIREIATEKKIKVFGSYDPYEYGLDNSDFFGLMHLKLKGLNKIFDPTLKDHAS